MPLFHAGAVEQAQSLVRVRRIVLVKPDTDKHPRSGTCLDVDLCKAISRRAGDKGSAAAIAPLAA